MSRQTTVAVLGGQLLQDIENPTKFRTSRLDEFEHDMCGCGLRGEAAAVLYRQNPDDSDLVVLGGRTPLHKQIPDAPLLSSVIKKELIHFGIPRDRIREIPLVDKTGTFEQLKALDGFIQSAGKGNKGRNILIIITNWWHLPRVRAMMAFCPAELPHLFPFSALNMTVAAEEILVADEPVWHLRLRAAYLRPEMRRIMSQELQGARQIVEGTYKFPKDFPQR